MPDGRRRRRGAEPVAQLATRLPKSLRQRVRFYCVERDVSMQDFVADAIKEKLARVKSEPER